MKWLTTKDVAERIGVTVGRVYQLISEKRLPAQKVGRDYLIEEKDLKSVAHRKPGRPKANPTKAKKRKATKNK